MRICPSCGTENGDDRDFCECGEYLRWEPTQHVEAVKPAPAPGAKPAAPSSRRSADVADAPPAVPRDPNITIPPGAAAVASPSAGPAAGESRQPVPAGSSTAPPDAPPGAATLLLRLPEDDSAAAGAVTVNVKPGERAMVLGLIRNESGIVDNYDISVSGFPDGWWTVTPATAYLVPYGTSGNYEQEVQVHLHPPRSPDAHARPWTVEVVASSRAYGTCVASAPATVTIEPYHDVAAKLAPDRAAGRLKARFLLTVHNRANDSAQLLMNAEDADGECQFRFAEPSVMIEPGHGIEAPLTVFPPKQIWIGRPKDRPIRVTAAPAGLEQPQTPLPAIYRQRPWLPWWLAPLLPIVAAAVALLILLAPKQTTVPNVKQAQSVFDAQKLLDKAGLKLAPQVNLVQNPSVSPGSIVDQSPQAGKHVKRGTLVTIQVAKGSGTVKVPSVIGLTPVAADQTLRVKGLSLGTVLPAPNPNGTIASQIPAGKVPVASGAFVNVYLKPAISAKGKVGAAAAAAGAAGAGAAGAGAAGAAAARAKSGSATGKPIVIPAVKGDVNAAAQQLSQLGLVPTSARRIATSPKGALIGTDPPAGSSAQFGSKVTLLVSAGFPELAYDDGKVVHVVDGATGASRATAPQSTQLQQEAMWSPDGTDLVYSQGGQLMMWAPNQPGARPSALTGTNSNEHDPAFAPKGGSKVLAFIDESNGGGRLCFAAVGPNQLNPDCTGYPGFSLTHQISWSPDGLAVLVLGIKNGSNHATFGLIEFTSNQRFTTDARAWGSGHLVTDISRPGEGIIAGAYSPDGKRLALVANIGTSGFYLYLAPRGDFKLAAPTKATATPACQVSWRADGQELAVMQADLPCSGSVGAIKTIDPSQLRTETNIAGQAADPAWQPVSTGA